MATRKKPAATDQLPLDAAGPASDLRLRLHRLTAKNFAGIEDLTVDFAEDVTILSGENASGKSSILAALRCVLGIDRVAATRRANVYVDEKPELEVTLLGADREVHVRRVGDGSPEVRERVGDDWRQVPRPVEWLRELIDVQGAVPAGFLQAKDDDRVTMLLEALELPGYDRAAALERAGLADFRLPAIPDGLHPLEDLESVMAAVFSSRTEVNRQRDAEKDAAKKLLDGLPAQPPEDGAAGLEAAQGEVDRLADDFARVESAIDAAHAKAIDVAKAERNRLIAEAERAYAEGVEAAQKARDAAVSGLDEQGRALGAARERLAALRARQESAATDRHVRATAKQALDKAKIHAARSEELTAALQALRAYAVELAGTLPIKGLEVGLDEKGKRVVKLDKKPLDQLSDSELQTLADEVSLLHAEARAGGRPTLPLILVDWYEKYDDANRIAHLKRLAEKGAQVVAAVVGSGPLQTVHGAVTAEVGA